MANANIKAVITAEDKASSVVSKFSKTSAVAFGAIAGIAQGVTTKAIDSVTDSIGDAIKRVDTLNNSTRVFANMGFKAADVKVAMDGLSASILGLPTPLDSAVRGMQMIASTTPDIKRAQSVFSAMNDAIIGFGGSADMVDNAVLQLSQAFSNGRIDAQTWNSMMQSGLGPTLNAMAKQMGITTGALKEGLSDGSISVQKFQDSLVELDKKGGGGLKSLQNIAHDATSGINTGIANAKTAIARGMAGIVQAIGADNISKAITSIGNVFEKTLKKIATFIPSAITAIRLFYDTITGGDPTIKSGEEGFIGFAKVLMTLRDAAMQAFNYLQPSLVALSDSITKNLWPALQNLWDALKPLLPIIGVALVIAIKELIVQWRIMIDVVSFIINIVTSLANFFLVTLPNAISVGVGIISGWIDYLKNHFWETVGFIIGFFALLPIKLPMYIIEAMDKINGYIASINWAAVFSGIGSAMDAVWEGAKSAAVRAFNYMKGINWIELNNSIGKGIGNAIVGMIEGALNGALSGIPGMKHINLPRFASGVQNFSGGMAIVGERGPELVNLPRGSDVIPNNQITRGGSTINISLNGPFMGSGSEARAYAQMIVDNIKDIASAKNMSVQEIFS